MSIRKVLGIRQKDSKTEESVTEESSHQDLEDLTTKVADSEEPLEEAMSKVELDDFVHDKDEQDEFQTPMDDSTYDIHPDFKGDLSMADDSGPSMDPPPHLVPNQSGGSIGHPQMMEEEKDLPMDGKNLPQVRDPRADEDDEDEDDDEDVQASQPEGAYDPADYEHLNVGAEIKKLFSYITRYTPQGIELEHRLRPYIPDYIPAVGDIDAFIKIPRPDSEDSVVGLSVLDEPSAKQSDATVLDLQLRAVAKHTTSKTVNVKTVENAEKNPKVIEKWVKDISDLHRAKPPPTVHYTKRMPEIDTLMQEWPGEVEELLKEINLPTAELEGELVQYADLICAILDIPVYKSRIQSLHILFTLYSVFKNSAHFRHLAEENYMDNNMADHLTLS